MSFTPINFDDYMKEKKLRQLEDEVFEAEQNIEKIQTELKANPLYATHYENYKNGIFVMKYIRCGKPGCRCQSPFFRHGPYFYFQYKENGKLKQKYLPKNKDLSHIRDLIETNQLLKKETIRLHKAQRALDDFRKKEGIK